eukprot:3413170-Amphidinium_carterae.1
MERLAWLASVTSFTWLVVMGVGLVALTPSADGAELVAGTRNGKLYRLLTSDLTATVQAVVHTDKVVAPKTSKPC